MIVLLNVARHASLASSVAQSSDATDVLVDLMQMFRDKKSIFCLSCELLGRLAAASEAIKVRNELTVTAADRLPLCSTHSRHISLLPRSPPLYSRTLAIPLTTASASMAFSVSSSASIASTHVSRISAGARRPWSLLVPPRAGVAFYPKWSPSTALNTSSLC